MRSDIQTQRTIAREAVVQGIGFFTGADVSLRFLPAEPDTGLVFFRSDLISAPPIPATIEHLLPQPRRTTLGNGGATVEMVEHVLAALTGLGIDQCRIEAHGPETPGCDGSSLAFVEALLDAGLVELDAPRITRRIEETLIIEDGPSRIVASPHPGDQLILSYELDYGENNPIGRQSFELTITPQSFHSELAPSRTFLLEAEAQALRALGMGARLSERDLLIIGDIGPIGNAYRFPDECVRHKMLDVLGDFTLLGCGLSGKIKAKRSGHHQNALMVRELLRGAPARHSPRPRLATTAS